MSYHVTQTSIRLWRHRWRWNPGISRHTLHKISTKIIVPTITPKSLFEGQVYKMYQILPFSFFYFFVTIFHSLRISKKFFDIKKWLVKFSTVKLPCYFFANMIKKQKSWNGCEVSTNFVGSVSVSRRMLSWNTPNIFLKLRFQFSISTYPYSRTTYGVIPSFMI